MTFIDGARVTKRRNGAGQETDWTYYRGLQLTGSTFGSQYSTSSDNSTLSSLNFCQQSMLQATHNHVVIAYEKKS